MHVEEAIETKLEPKLRDAFDVRTTKSLLTMATLAYVTTVGGEIQRYRAFADSICTDERVVQKWGEAAATRQAREWKDLVPLEPEPVVIVSPQVSGC